MNELHSNMKSEKERGKESRLIIWIWARMGSWGIGRFFFAFLARCSRSVLCLMGKSSNYDLNSHWTSLKWPRDPLRTWGKLFRPVTGKMYRVSTSEESIIKSKCFVHVQNKGNTTWRRSFSSAVLPGKSNSIMELQSSIFLPPEILTRHSIFVWSNKINRDDARGRKPDVELNRGWHLRRDGLCLNLNLSTQSKLRK